MRHFVNLSAGIRVDGTWHGYCDIILFTSMNVLISAKCFLITCTISDFVTLLSSTRVFYEKINQNPYISIF